MDRRGLSALTALFVAVPFGAASCGDAADEAAATLPPIATTTSTTIVVTTTTEYIPVTYEIAAGDSLRNIADTYGVDYDELISVNGILDPDHIEAGDVLDIPAPSTTTTTSTATTSTTLAPTTTTQG